jgi:hypothetical protein
MVSMERLEVDQLTSRGSNVQHTRSMWGVLLLNAAPVAAAQVARQAITQDAGSVDIHRQTEGGLTGTSAHVQLPQQQQQLLLGTCFDWHKPSTHVWLDMIEGH